MTSRQSRNTWNACYESNLKNLRLPVALGEIQKPIRSKERIPATGTSEAGKRLAMLKIVPWQESCKG
jgi:hypothetical protein